jgi:membrane protease YdiL (CAAX protease family)
MSQYVKKKLAIFLVLTAAFSAVFHVLNARAGAMQQGYTIGLMWSPGVAALIVQLLTEGSLRGLGWRWGKTRYQLLSVAVPFFLVAATYGFVWLTGLGAFPDPAFVEEGIMAQIDLDLSRAEAILAYAVVSSTFGLVTSSFTALGEEIGWRGLMVPGLTELTGFTGTSLVSGAIWAVWHYPGILFADYRGGGPVWYSLICFTAMAIGFSFVLAWVRLKSGSVWTATFAHAAHNVFVQTIFTPLTADTGLTEYVIDEFGVGLAVAYAAAAFVVWRLRQRLPDRGAAQA